MKRETEQLRLITIGAGRCAGAMSSLLKSTGAELVAGSARDIANLSQLNFKAKFSYKIGAGVAPGLVELLTTARDTHTLVMLGVPDRLLSLAATELAQTQVSWEGISVIHLSGIIPVAVLQPFVDKGAQTGALHPCYPFTKAARTIELQSCVFEGQPELAQMLKDRFSELNIAVMPVKDLKRDYYHAANVLAAGHIATLLAAAEKLLLTAGLDRLQARTALKSLLNGQFENLTNLEQDLAQAITGPFVRGDAETIAMHKNALVNDSDLQNIYQLLGELSEKLTREL